MIGLTDATLTHYVIHEVRLAFVRPRGSYWDTLELAGSRPARVHVDFPTRPRSSPALEPMASLSITALQAPKFLGSEN